MIEMSSLLEKTIQQVSTLKIERNEALKAFQMADINLKKLKDRHHLLLKKHEELHNKNKQFVDILRELRPKIEQLKEEQEMDHNASAAVNGGRYSTIKGGAPRGLRGLRGGGGKVHTGIQGGGAAAEGRATVGHQ